MKAIIVNKEACMKIINYCLLAFVLAGLGCGSVNVGNLDPKNFENAGGGNIVQDGGGDGSGNGGGNTDVCAEVATSFSTNVVPIFSLSITHKF